MVTDMVTVVVIIMAGTEAGMIGIGVGTAITDN
jgi:hypothetical protein